AAVALAACGGGASTGGGATPLNVTVTTTEFKYDPATINATPGQTINLTVKNIGSVQHSFVFATANVKIIVDPGKSVTQTFTAPAAGTYTFECDIAGHKEAGMVGQLIVK
ncbi:MAG TPA: cupredoxin domain-containing protein, partial [Anaerolineae bacterium]